MALCSNTCGAALGQRPALLCFDDVHLALADATIMSVLRFLSASTPATLLLTSREDVMLPALAQVNLAGLEPEEAQELVSRLDLQAAPPLRQRLLAKTGRSPMLLRLAAGGLLGQETNAADFIEHLQTQPQVSAYILDTMLRDLSPAAAWLAGLIAVFRQPVDLFDETLGDLLRLTLRIGEAESSYREALTLAPSPLQVWRGVGEARVITWWAVGRLGRVWLHRR
ncbi:MAG: hypothetical protein WA089_20615 [Anaerolineae bacterium]